jgi:hypothetical protein
MHSIWAIAINTVKQALRMKIAVVFTVLLVVVLPLMGAVTTGDGTLKGRLQTFVSYGLSLASFVLCLLTIVISIYSVTNDIKQSQIYTVLTKPVRRFQFLLGKLLGVILLDISLLVLFSALIYTITISIPRFVQVEQKESVKARNEFFTARAALIPKEVDVTKEVLEIYKKREKNQEVPQEVLQNKAKRQTYLNMLAENVKRWKRAAVPGRELVWTFDNVKPFDPNESMFIRYKYDVSVNPPDLQVTGNWFIGDNRSLGTISETPFETRETKDLIRTFHEMEVPAKTVAKDGFLAVAFFNNPALNNTIVIFHPQEGLEVLYKADTFTANYARAVFLILLRLVFLACLGILASSFLSFPVAILFCLVIFFAGMISGFITDSFNYISEGVGAVYSFTVKPLMQLLPQFDKHNPTKYLIDGRLLSSAVLAKTAVIMVCIKAFLLLILSIIIFTYREIAKVVV